MHCRWSCWDLSFPGGNSYFGEKQLYKTASKSGSCSIVLARLLRDEVANKFCQKKPGKRNAIPFYVSKLIPLLQSKKPSHVNFKPHTG